MPPKFGITRKELSDLAAKHSEGGDEVLAEKYGGVPGVLKSLAVDSNKGIANDEREYREQMFGRNQIKEDPMPTFLELCWEALQDPTLIMLLICAGIQLILAGAVEHWEIGAVVEAVAIYATVLIVTLVASGTDYQKNLIYYAQKAKAAAGQVNVWRDGKMVSADLAVGQGVSKFDIVVGDIIKLTYGDMVPCDGLFIEGEGIEMDEAALTGEPDRVKKDAVKDPFILAGTGVKKGTGRMVAIAVGENSAAGKINAAVKGALEFEVLEGEASVKENGRSVLFTPDNRMENVARTFTTDFPAMKIKVNDQTLDIDTENKIAKQADGKSWQIPIKQIWPLKDFTGEMYAGKTSEKEGSVLGAKLEVMVEKIGYFGLTMSILTFLAVLIRWGITSFSTIQRSFETRDLVTTCSAKFFEAGGIFDTKRVAQGQAILKDAYNTTAFLAGDVKLDVNTHLVQSCKEPPCCFEKGEFSDVATEDVCADSHGLIQCEKVYLTLKNHGKAVQFKTFQNATTPNPWTKERNDYSQILKAFTTGIAIFVVAVPEGLPLAVTLALVYSSMKMQSPPTNCFVRHIDACETMGNATAICSDKTGTLTANRMKVQRTFLAGGIIGTATRGRPAEGQFSDAFMTAMKEGLCLNTGENTDVKFPADGKGEPEYFGNDTECALYGYACLVYSEKECCRIRDPATFAWPKGVRLFPFSSQLKRMSIVVKRVDAAGKTIGTRVYTKGASEVVLLQCSSLLNKDGSTKPLNAEDRNGIKDQAITPFANDMLRTIALAYKDFDRMPPKAGEEKTDPYWSAVEQDALTDDLTLIGIFGIEDQVREEVPHAIEQCDSAGITVRMCTGDNLRTASAIAKTCGLVDEDCTLQTYEMEDDDGKKVQTDVLVDSQKRIVGMEGKRFRNLVFDMTLNQPRDGGEALNAVWPQLRVLARCSPNDKYILVKGMRESRLYLEKATMKYKDNKDIGKYQEVVAVTGDGTNDAPALSTANVGFAMGIQGTDIAKDACDIILMDDNFTSIVEAVKWGRNVYDSIAKFLQFQLTVNVVALVIAFVGACTSGSSPLTTVQMLWVNVIMDTAASLALATEPPTDALLNRKPYGKTKGLISKRMWRFILSSALYQIIILFICLYSPGSLGFKETNVLTLKVQPMEPTTNTDAPTIHYTLIFNIFVLCQIFNEINARMLGDEVNVFAGIHKNPFFYCIWIGTMAIQVVAVQYGKYVFRSLPLDADQWFLCLAYSVGNLAFGIMVKAFVKKEVFTCFGKGEMSEEELTEIMNQEGEGSFMKSSFMRKRGGASVDAVLKNPKKSKGGLSKDGFSASGDYNSDNVWPSTKNANAK